MQALYIFFNQFPSFRHGGYLAVVVATMKTENILEL